MMTNLEKQSKLVKILDCFEFKKIQHEYPYIDCFEFQSCWYEYSDRFVKKQKRIFTPYVLF